MMLVNCLEHQLVEYLVINQDYGDGDNIIIMAKKPVGIARIFESAP